MNTTHSVTAANVYELETLRDNWGLFLVFGLISMFVGFVAIGSTVVATLASVFLFKWRPQHAGRSPDDAKLQGYNQEA